MGKAQSNNEGLMRGGRWRGWGAHVYLGQTNEQGRSNKTEQKWKTERVSSRNRLLFMVEWRVWTNTNNKCQFN